MKIEATKISNSPIHKVKVWTTTLYRGLEDELRPLLTIDKMGISQTEVIELIR